MDASETLSAQLRRLMVSGEGDFASLALALFAHQRANNPDYAAYCADAAPSCWQEIPAVPVALFRDLPLTSYPPNQARHTFKTSGTTGKRGQHRLRDTVLYDLGARRWAEACLGAIPTGGVSLVSHSPTSSLGHMSAAFAPDLQRFFSAADGLDAAGAWCALAAADAPIFVPGTAFAFAELLASAPGRVCPLPAGSIVMVTGGFKGRRRTLSHDDLCAALEAALPGGRLVGEYGMTELSSQLWSTPLGGDFVAPPWMRVVAVDPGTGEPTEEEGLLRFYDLANHQTVLAIETRDVGVVRPGNRVTLRGRLPGAPDRGCSLTVEEAAAPPVPPPQPRPEPAFARDLRVGAGMPQPGDRQRVQRVRAALARLTPPTSEGLAPAVARAGLEAAVDGVTEAGLLAELSTPGRRPQRVAIVCAEGVFTAAIEWAALYAAAGCAVLLKAPQRTPGFLFHLAEALSAAGFPVRATTDRDLGDPDVVVTFGADETLAAVSAAWPRARHVGFGHRFSAAFLSGPADAAAAARDVLMFDTRGCMAPAALFVPADQAEATAEALARALRQADPGGGMHSALGPEHRRRLGLARALGSVRLGEDWAVLTLPPEHLTPAALPRVAMLHPVTQPTDLTAAMRPWRHQLSTLGAVDTQSPWLDGVRAWFPRWSPLGAMQTPRLPRRHDGVRMLGCVLERR